MKLFHLDILLKQNPLLILHEANYLLLVSPSQQSRGVWCGKNGNPIIPHSHAHTSSSSVSSDVPPVPCMR